ncbi:Uncharacterised protein [Klebsiella pneumoniae]|nr:Uncharacterised protein [Klebsiella pneumoniae]
MRFVPAASQCMDAFPLGDYYHIGYMVPSGASDGGGVKEIVTYSFEFKLADGNTFQITEADKGIPVTGVTLRQRPALSPPEKAPPSK